LNTAAQIHRLHAFFDRIGPNWQSAARGYQVIVLDRPDRERVRKSLLADRRLRETYLGPEVSVLVRATTETK
jgi:hypothetical protein